MYAAGGMSRASAGCFVLEGEMVLDIREHWSLVALRLGKGGIAYFVSVSIVFRVFDKTIWLNSVLIQLNTYNDNHVKLEIYSSISMICLHKD